jgi:hypothetical protein
MIQRHWHIWRRYFAHGGSNAPTPGDTFVVTENGRVVSEIVRMGASPTVIART